MSADEVRVRIGSSVRRRRERRIYASRKASPPQVTSLPGLAAGCRAVVFGGHQACRHDLPTTLACLSTTAATNARRITEARWSMLGHEYDLTGKVDWHRDPRTGHQFPRTFYADVPKLQGSGGPVDVKYVWELGRHQFVVELARGWLMTGDEAFAERGREIILSWIENNPLYEGVHWTSGLEVAVRAISWIWALATTAEWKGWSEADLRIIGQSLAEHANYLENHFSYYSSPYNHLAGEAAGLYLISQVLKSRPDAARWRARARQVLTDYGPRQFDSDGFCVEQATGYHFFTLGFLAMAIITARRENEPFLEVEVAAHRAFRAGAVFQQPDGRWPAIGDVDSARAIPVEQGDFWDFRGLMSLGAVLFNDPDLKTPLSAPGSELFWLMGAEGIEHWNRLPTHEAPSSTLLKDAGYAVYRSGKDWVLLDAGPIAHGLFSDSTPSTAHGHLDVLQVLAVLDGEQVLRDAGMPYYFGERDWVRHFRGAAAHNTLAVDGLEFARDAGGLAWSDAHLSTVIDATESDGEWTARGMAKFPASSRLKHGAAVIEREVRVSSESHLTIVDRMRLDRLRSATWHWQLPGDSRPAVTRTGPHQLEVRQDRLRMLVQSSAPILSAELVLAGNGPSGWEAEGYGLKHPLSSLRIVVSECRDFELTTSISATSATREPGETRPQRLAKRSEIFSRAVDS